MPPTQFSCKRPRRISAGSGSRIGRAEAIPSSKRVIFLLHEGSPVRTWTPSITNPTSIPTAAKPGTAVAANMLGSRWKFRQTAKAALDVELFPPLRTCAGRSVLSSTGLQTEIPRTRSLPAMHTGSLSFVRRHLGGGLTTGLGSLNKNLPRVCHDTPASRNWVVPELRVASFLPGSHQGTRLGKRQGDRLQESTTGGTWSQTRPNRTATANWI